MMCAACGLLRQQLGGAMIVVGTKHCMEGASTLWESNLTAESLPNVQTHLPELPRY